MKTKPNTHAIAIFYGPKVKGTVTFYQPKNKSGSYISFDLKGLGKNRESAIHIHEYGDMRDGCISLGAHWNPRKKEHGNIELNGNNRHSGDLINNIKANGKGDFKFSYYDPLVKVRGNESILGRSIVIHDGVDDLGLGGYPDSKTTGHAGGRRACAIVVHFHVK